MVLHLLQPSLNGGEIAPSLRQRPDLQKFSTCVKSLKNFLVHPEGGISNRAGTLMLGKAKDEYVRTIGFEYNKNNSYVLEFGSKYIRFYTPEGQILKEDGTPLEIETPFQTEDLDALRVCQVADVMYIAWGAMPKKLTRYGHSDWRLEDYAFKNGPYDTNASFLGFLNKEKNDNLYEIWLSSAEYVFTEKDKRRMFRGTVTLKSQSYGARVSSTAVKTEVEAERFFIAGGYTIQTSGTWSGTIALEYSEDGINWKTKKEFVSFDGSSNYDWSGSFEGAAAFARFNLSRLGTFSTSGLKINISVDSEKYNLNMKGTTLKGSDSIFVELQDVPGGILDFVSAGGQLAEYTLPVLTSNTSAEDLSIAGNAADLDNAYKALDGNEETYMVCRDVNKTVDFYFKNDVVCSGIKALFSGYRTTGGGISGVNWATAKIACSVLRNGSWIWVGYFMDEAKVVESQWYTLTWSTQSIEAIRFEMYHDDSYGAKLNEFSLINPFIVEESPEYFETAPGLWREGEYPKDVDLYQDRLNWTKKANLDASQISAYEDFGVSAEVSDDEAIDVVLADKQINQINAIVSANKLVVFTDRGNFVHDNTTFTPSTATFSKEGQSGGSDVKPVVARESVIYALPGKESLADYRYTYESDGYTGTDITLLARHLFRNEEVKELVWQNEPDSQLWVILKSGKLLCCCYLKQENVLGWSHMETDGEVQSGCVIYEGDRANLYLAVKRETGTFIEKMAVRLLSDEPEEQFFVDCGRSYRGEETDAITGLEYLEGQEVAVLADGMVQKRKTVQNGQIELDYPASVVHVGLPYEAEVVSLSADVSMEDGTMLDRRKRIVGVTVFFTDTSGGVIGTEGFELDPADRVCPAEFNKAAPLRDFRQKMTLQGVHEYAPSLVIKQADPLPMTVVGWVPEIAPGG